MEISGFQALRSGLRDVPPRTAVVAAAHDPHTLEAVFQAQRDGLIRPLLVGERDKILRMAEDLGAPMPEEDVVDARDDRECANRSVELIRQGQGQLLIKGLLPTGPCWGQWSGGRAGSVRRNCCPMWPFWTSRPTTSSCSSPTEAWWSPPIWSRSGPF